MANEFGNMHCGCGECNLSAMLRDEFVDLQQDILLDPMELGPTCCSGVAVDEKVEGRGGKGIEIHHHEALALYIVVAF